MAGRRVWWGKVEEYAIRWEEVGSSPISRVLSSRPVSQPACRAVIPLDDALPRRSSSLPGDSASSVDVPLFGLAPDGVYRAVRVTTSAVGSYPTVSPLPDLLAEPSAVCSLLHFPSLSPEGYGARPLAGILLYGARTFLDARTHRDCLANFPARSIATSAPRRWRSNSARTRHPPTTMTSLRTSMFIRQRTTHHCRPCRITTQPHADPGRRAAKV